MSFPSKFRFLFIFICVVSIMVLPNFTNEIPDFVFVIEEVIGVILFILGLLIFQPLIKKIHLRFHKNILNPEDRFRKIVYIISTALLLSLVTSIILFLILKTYHAYFGVPEFYELKQEILNYKKLNFESGVKVPHWFDMPPFSAFQYLPTFLGGSIIMFLLLFGLEEYKLYNTSIQEKKLQRAREAKELAISKVYAIQHQLNPHFMFNTLNVLSGLMHEDLDKADVFIKKLSEIYRYVLLQTEEIVASLDKEIEFTKAYIYLLKIRFEDKLFVKINIDENMLNWLVPSLTLELLIENAIKHNSLDTYNPLRIEIYIEHENLIVKNNIIPRMDSMKSTGIGIKNLKNRLLALGIDSSRFEATNKFFTATIPLIKSI